MQIDTYGSLDDSKSSLFVSNISKQYVVVALSMSRVPANTDSSDMFLSEDDARELFESVANMSLNQEAVNFSNLILYSGSGRRGWFTKLRDTVEEIVHQVVKVVQVCKISSMNLTLV